MTWPGNAKVPVLLGKLGLAKVRVHQRAGTFEVKRSKRVRRVKVVSADGQGVVSHAGVGLLREMAEYTGLVDACPRR